MAIFEFAAFPTLQSQRKSSLLGRNAAMRSLSQWRVWAVRCARNFGRRSGSVCQPTCAKRRLRTDASGLKLPDIPAVNWERRPYPRNPTCSSRSEFGPDWQANGNRLRLTQEIEPIQLTDNLRDYGLSLLLFFEPESVESTAFRGSYLESLSNLGSYRLGYCEVALVRSLVMRIGRIFVMITHSQILEAKKTDYFARRNVMSILRNYLLAFGIVLLPTFAYATCQDIIDSCNQQFQWDQQWCSKYSSNVSACISEAFEKFQSCKGSC